MVDIYMVQREVTQKRNTKQVQQKKTEDPTVCEFDEVHDGIEVGRKMSVAAKLGKNKEMKPKDKQIEVEDKKKDQLNKKQKHIYKILKSQKGRYVMSDEIHTNPPPDSLCHHLHPAYKREVRTSDSGASCNSSPSIDQLRSRIAKRPTLIKK